ncbi:MAG: ABC transporter ATP-binding protein [Chloracidobacterium sp.]|nr:ABC transporter ATP-binding protein [Chloracidobacterium sp.]
MANATISRNIIEMRGITKRFGAVTANQGVDISIPAGSIHAIVGENGAGKSTIMKILYGVYAADEGEIWIDGEKREIRSPRDAIALGVGMAHQHFMLASQMTALENIILGAEPGGAARIDFKQAEERVNNLLKDFEFDIDPHQRVEELSVGRRQRVEVLKALYRGARILILDEPTAVLAPQEVEDLFRILRSMRDQGRTIIIITHKLTEALSLSDNVTVMRDGQVVGEMKAKKTNAKELARMMVGREVSLRIKKGPAKPRGVTLAVKNLSYGSKLDGVSFEVRAGEIVGIAGVEGNGQTELIEILAGLRRATGGSVTLEGHEISRLSARAVRELSVAHIPEDRHARGLLLDFNLADNCILGVHYRRPAVADYGLIDEQAVIEKASRLIRDFEVRPPDPAAPARALSGGNQQKLIVGREFDQRPKLLLVAQPTRGVDVGAIEFIHRKLIELRDTGAAVLLVSAELEEVLSLADRAMVIYQGRIVGEIDPQRADLEEIGLMMTCGKNSTEASLT